MTPRNSSGHWEKRTTASPASTYIATSQNSTSATRPASRPIRTVWLASSARPADADSRTESPSLARKNGCSAEPPCSTRLGKATEKTESGVGFQPTSEPVRTDQPYERHRSDWHQDFRCTPTRRATRIGATHGQLPAEVRPQRARRDPARYRDSAKRNALSRSRRAGSGPASGRAPSDRRRRQALDHR